jgi:dolichol-phosphate mannosyltransferase
MATSGGPVTLSVVIPTYNERDNIARLVCRILSSNPGIPLEVIVVDDGSPDGTAQIVRDLGEPQVRVVERSGKAGLSSAVFAGAEASKGDYICVMDADLSHDPAEIPQMLAVAQQGWQVVIGSRYAPGAKFVGQPMFRRLLSRILNGLARGLFAIRSRDVLTGYALLERDVILSTPTRYSHAGFKWLLEVLATHKGLKVCEWPIVFRDRKAGLSKATIREAAVFGVLCWRLLGWRTRRALRLA